MAKYIDIKDFDGALTNADLEDLPDNVAQEIKNLKIQAGKLEKTFGAGTPSGIPSIGLSFVNTKLGTTYTVYNIFAFVSDKFTGNANESGDGFRYLLVTIDTSNLVKLWWYDPSLPDVTDHLQIEDNIVWFKTASAHGIVEDDFVLVQDCKSNASPQADISGAGVYGQADHVPSTTTVGVNTTIATGWGGSFFDTTTATGITQRSFGGKCQTHLKAIDQVTHGGTAQSKIYDIAVASMNGKVLSLMLVDANQTLLVTYDGSTMADLSQTNYNTFKTKSNFKVCSMIGYNNAIYVHMSYTDSGNYNRIVKYTLSSGGVVQESLISANVSADDYTDTSFMHIVGSSLYILIENNGLFKIDSSDNITEVTINVSPAPDLTKVVGLTAIRSTNNLTHSNGSGSNVSHIYLFVILATTTTTKIYYSDISATGIGTGNWYVEDSFTGVTQSVTSFDFGQNSSRSGSIVLHYTNSGNHYVKYSTHDDSTVILGWADVSSSTFGTSVPISFVNVAKNSPGTDYLVVGTDDVSSPAQDNGALYLVDSSLSVQVAHAPDESTMKTWNPSCFADCITETHGGQDFFEHAKGYIAVYGTESTHGSPTVASADLYRMTDIGWLLNSWNGSGDCEYRWIDLMSYYSIKEVDTSNVTTTPSIYHKKDRNPIAVDGDNIRFLAGSVGKISNIEAKGVWLGYINRSLFNDTVSADPNWFIYANKLNNPFTINSTKMFNTGESLRPGNSVKYNVTAIYDGVQETLFDKSKEIILIDTDINKKIIELNIEFDANALNRRITGLNVYRSTEFTNTTNFDGYSNFQLIGHMTFVDTQNDLPTITDAVITRIHCWKDNIVFIKGTGDLTSYDGENSVGTNEYALETDGGFDGIDSANDWFGPTSNSVSVSLSGVTESPNRPYAFLIYHSELQRTMTATQGYMVVSELEKDNTLDNSDKLQLEDEAITISNTTVTSGTNTIYTSTISGSGPFTFTLNTSLTNTDEFAINDTFTVANLSSSIVFTITQVNSLSIVASASSGSGYSGSSGAIKLQSVASGVLVDVNRGQLPIIHNADTTPSSLLTTAVSHATGTNILIRAESLPRSYSRLRLDSNAHFDDNYLDDGTMIGSDWKIKERSGTSYTTTSQTSTSGGAYGGQKVAFLYFENPDDITGTLGTDITGNTLTVGSLGGNVLITNSTEEISEDGTTTNTEKADSYIIENNSAYEPTLGGCWIKVNKGFKSTKQHESGLVLKNVRMLNGFKRLNAQGATTPGMAFNVTSGTNVRVVCQDFNLEDLGESTIQSVFSNRVNAQHAVKLKGRLFMGDIVLNPEDKAEDHPDWIAYSELNQYDVRPVSNVINLDDREGGAVTGLAVLFGRLIIFKPQAIFIMNVSDPADPNTWSISESKFSIGNIAPEGVVEVHDSVYFVFHDGIYAVTSNTVADSTKTPSVMDKISLSIEDQFLLANSKKDIKGVYDQKNNEILYSWGVSNAGFYLDGVDDYLQDTSVTNMPSGFGVTLSAWFKTDSSSAHVILGLYDSGSTNNFLSIGVLGGSVIAYHFSGIGSVQVVVGSGYDDNEWHHLTVVFEGSASRKIYVDGSLVSTNTSSSAFPTSLDTISIGRHADSSPNNYYKGYLARCNVFNVSFNDSEVSDLKAIGRTSSISSHSRFSNCIASYLMGNGVGDTVSTIKDQTSNGNDLTVTGASLLSGSLETTTQVNWAYHIKLNTWRKIETSTNLDILSFGENSGPIAWDNTDKDLKKFDVDEAVGIAWKSKRFRMDLDKKRLIRYGMIQFTGTDTLTVNVYLDGSGSASFTKDITADGGVNRFPIKRYGKNFEIELTTPSSTNPFSVERMRIETE